MDVAFISFKHSTSLKEEANSVDYIFPNYVPYSFEETCVEAI
jgi:hypothetical protein